MDQQNKISALNEGRKNILSSKIDEYLIKPKTIIEGNENILNAIKYVNKASDKDLILVKNGTANYGLITKEKLNEFGKIDPKQTVVFFINRNIPEVSKELYAVQAVETILQEALPGLVVTHQVKDITKYSIATLESLLPVDEVLTLGTCHGDAPLGELLIGTPAGLILFSGASIIRTTPEGPYVTKKDCECAVIIYVKDSTIGNIIDAKTGNHGYSHVAIDCCECEESTGKRVIIEAVADGVIRSYADKYDGRPSVRIPVKNHGIDCEEFCRKVKDHLGEPFDIPELITGGLIDDPEAQVCADLVTISIPEELLIRILGKMDDELRDTIKVKGNTIVISPNAFALCAGAPDGADIEDEETPVPPPEPDPSSTSESDPPQIRRECNVKIDLLRITHRGGFLGDDWAFKAIVQGRQRIFPERTLRNYGTRHIAENFIDRKIDFCEDSIPIDYVCEATERDAGPNDFGATSRQKNYTCPSHQLENITVRVSETAVGTARITFVFDVTLTCV